MSEPKFISWWQARLLLPCEVNSWKYGSNWEYGGEARFIAALQSLSRRDYIGTAYDLDSLDNRISLALVVERLTKVSILPDSVSAEYQDNSPAGNRGSPHWGTPDLDRLYLGTSSLGKRRARIIGAGVNEEAWRAAVGLPRLGSRPEEKQVPFAEPAAEAQPLRGAQLKEATTKWFKEGWGPNFDTVPAEAELLQLAQNEVSASVTMGMVRDLRRKCIPDKFKKGGQPTHKAKRMSRLSR
jgi:hypothetical protein